MIHYYEDGRDELYHLEEDLGERPDLAEQHPDRVKKMRRELMEFLHHVGAKFPDVDPRFDEEKAQEKQRQIREQLLPELEQRHAGFLKPDFRRNPRWWGSLVDPQESLE